VLGGAVPEAAWAIEGAEGLGFLLAQQLVAAGESVVDVPATLAARTRVLASSRSNTVGRLDSWSAPAGLGEVASSRAEDVCLRYVLGAVHELWRCTSALTAVNPISSMSSASAAMARTSP